MVLALRIPPDSELTSAFLLVTSSFYTREPIGTLGQGSGVPESTAPHPSPPALHPHARLPRSLSRPRWPPREAAGGPHPRAFAQAVPTTQNTLPGHSAHCSSPCRPPLRRRLRREAPLCAPRPPHPLERHLPAPHTPARSTAAPSAFWPVSKFFFRVSCLSSVTVPSPAVCPPAPLGTALTHGYAAGT